MTITPWVDRPQVLMVSTAVRSRIPFSVSTIRSSREAMGVRGIRLREGDYVVDAARAVPGKAVLTITEKGYGKQTPVEEYRITAWR